MVKSVGKEEEENLVEERSWLSRCAAVHGVRKRGGEQGLRFQFSPVSYVGPLSKRNETRRARRNFISSNARGRGR